MNDSSDGMNGLTTAITNIKKDDIVINLDWRGSKARAVDPNSVDEWIRPTAQEVVSKLKNQWNFTNNQKLNLVGHSMGTFMVTEISRALGNRENLGDTKSLTLLDPPSFLLASNYTVDKRPGTTDNVYNATSGYRQKARVHTGNIQAYTGIKRIGGDGETNWCGNVELNRTVDQSISVYMPDLDDATNPGPPLIGGGGLCPIHGGVITAYAALIANKKVSIDGQEKLSIDGEGLLPRNNNTENQYYNQTQFYKDDYNFRASITVQGSNDVQFIQTFDGGAFNQWGKNNEDTTFWNFGKDTYNSKNKKLTKIRDFNGNDKISLQKVDNDNQYRISGNTIERNAKNASSSLFGGYSGWYNDVVVEGGRVNNLLPGELANKLSEGLSNQNGNDWFIPR